MATQKDELVEKTRAKIIELFGPESALAQAMEDDGFFDKLGDLISWLFGEIILSQPRPEPRYPGTRPEPRYPGTKHPGTPWARKEWADPYTTGVTHETWADKFKSVRSKYTG